MKVILKNVRASFVDVHTPKVNTDDKGNVTRKYGINGLMDPGTEIGAENIAKLEEAMEEVAKEKWKDKAPAILKACKAKDKVCLHDGDGKTQDGYAGMMYVSANSDTKPKIRDVDGRTELTADSGKPYSGCFVNLVLDVWAQDNQHGKRVNAQVTGVQFRSDGDRFGGGTTADDDDFEELEPSSDDDFNDI